MSSNSKSQKCYIAASPKDDLYILKLKKFLENRGIEVSDAYSFSLRDYKLPERNEFRIKRSNFLIAVVSLKKPNPNVFYELGIARAMCKPIFLIIRDEGTLPTSISEMTYIKAPPDNLETIFYGLDKFLSVVIGRYVQKKTGTPEQNIPLEVISPVHVEESEQEPVLPKNGMELLEALKNLFEKQGIVYFVEKSSESRSDMSLWIDSLESTIGNPILVELKTGYLTEEILCEAEQRLIESMKTVHGRGGLLIYADSGGRHFKRSKWKYPLIIRIDFRELISEAGYRPLDVVILSERNQIVHSGE
jgi:hypothetical protein